MLQGAVMQKFFVNFLVQQLNIKDDYWIKFERLIFSDVQNITNHHSNDIRRESAPWLNVVPRKIIYIIRFHVDL